MTNEIKYIAPMRRNDIDWLRIIGICIVIVIHVTKIFDHNPASAVKNPDRSFAMDVLANFLVEWIMPLFFFASGWSTYISLRHRGTLRFLWERVRRVLIPFATGCILVLPVVRFIELANQGNRESFVHFLPCFFTDPDLFFKHHLYHLWFPAYLFATTIVFLPLILWIWKTKWRVESASRAAPYLLLVPFIIVRMIMSPRWPSTWLLYNDWADFLHYSLFFIVGFVFSRYPGFEAAVQKEWKRLLLMSIVATGILVPIWAEMKIYTLSPQVYAALYAAAGYSFIMAAAGFARRFADTANVYVGYLREATFPIYIIHYPAITIIAFYVVQLQLAIALKFAIIILAATALTMLAYHFLVRSIPPVRLILGMSPRLKAHKAS